MLLLLLLEKKSRREREVMLLPSEAEHRRVDNLLFRYRIQTGYLVQRR